jgi:hypothetical protein
LNFDKVLFLELFTDEFIEGGESEDPEDSEEDELNANAFLIELLSLIFRLIFLSLLSLKQTFFCH